MLGARLDKMSTDAVSFDLETHLLQPGLQAPPPVCGSAAMSVNGQLHGSIYNKHGAYTVWQEILANKDYTVCGANLPFDVLVMATYAARQGIDLMPQVYDLYDPDRTIIRGACDGRVFDVIIAEQLHAIAQGHLGQDPKTGRPMTNPDTGKRGRYSLRSVVQQVLGRDNAKANDAWRLRYFELENLPISQWPFEAQTYPVDDAVNTLEAALAQAGHRPSCNAHIWFEVNVPVGTRIDKEMHCTRCKARLTGNVPQDCMAPIRRRNLHDLSRQVYADFALKLAGAWGFRVDQEAVNALEAKYVAEHEGKMEPFYKAGILRSDGSEDQSVLKRMVAIAYGSKADCTVCLGTKKIPSEATGGKTKVNCSSCGGTGLELTASVPRTPKDGVVKGRDTLQESGDELLMAYADASEGKKIPTTYIPWLRGTDKQGVAHPGVPLTLWPNSLLETGRVSYDGVVQLLPRKGGVRECIVARPAHVFSTVDYFAGELITHGQSCLWLVGASRMAEALNAGLDCHLALAGSMCGKSYEEAMALKKAGNKLLSDLRQAAKPANFGYPGGMAELTFCIRQREGGPDTPCPAGPTWVKDESGNKVPGYKGLRPCILMDRAERCGEEMITTYKDKPCPPVCRRCVVAAKRLKEFWLKTWPENRTYFDVIKGMLRVVGPSGTPEIVQHASKRVRGGVDFCSASNGFFQGLLGEATKNAICAASRECYDRTVRVESSEMMTSAYAGGPSPLLGSRIILDAHDELITEHPESVAHDGATRMSELLVEALRFLCPDMKKAIRADPAIMRRWWKGAEAVFENGRLVPWEPKH